MNLDDLIVYKVIEIRNGQETERDAKPEEIASIHCDYSDLHVQEVTLIKNLDCESCVHTNICTWRGARYCNWYVNNSCEDVISRKEAYEVVDHMLMGDLNHKITALKEIKQLPPVNMQPRIGQWVRKADEVLYTCNQCWVTNATGEKYNYCPNCGAKMGVDG